MNNPTEASSATSLLTGPAARPVPPAAHSILLWFDALALVIGAAHILFEPAHRSAVIFAYSALCATAFISRALPSIRRKATLRNFIDVLGLLVFASCMAWGTGGVASELVPLFLLPLTAAAISLPRALYGMIASSVLLVALALAIATPGVEISASFVVSAISRFAPMLIATAAIVVLMEQMRGAEQYILDISTRDALTGLANRRVFEDILSRQHRKAERGGQPFCVVLVHVDNASVLRQAQGVNVANQLITAVATSTSRSIRASDVAARFSDDEFIVLLADTDLPIGNSIAQRIRNHVYAGTISLGNRMVRANVHIGLVAYPKDRRELHDLMQLVEQRMQHDRELHRPLAE